jgi:hypothetical protein
MAPARPRRHWRRAPPRGRAEPGPRPPVDYPRTLRPRPCPRLRARPLVWAARRPSPVPTIQPAARQPPSPGPRPYLPRPPAAGAGAPTPPPLPAPPAHTAPAPRQHLEPPLAPGAARSDASLRAAGGPARALCELRPFVHRPPRPPEPSPPPNLPFMRPPPGPDMHGARPLPAGPGPAPPGRPAARGPITLCTDMARAAF